MVPQNLGRGRQEFCSLSYGVCRLAVVLSITLAELWTAKANPVMEYLHDAPESGLDNRYQYQWAVLRTALEKTIPESGPYVMSPAKSMSENRQIAELKNTTGKLSIMYLGTTPEIERDLLPIRIPVDKNLGGYCLFLIRKENQRRFDQVNSLEDLKQFKYGLGLGWIDVEILKTNHFEVVTASCYDCVFEMVYNRRSDLALRGAVEIMDELKQREKLMPELCIEQTLLFYYPMPMYFWFAKTPEGRRLASRAEKGMRLMIEDGSYDKIFTEYQDQKIQRLNLKGRKIFKINNPLLGPETPLEDKRLWFTPDSYEPKR